MDPERAYVATNDQYELEEEKAIVDVLWAVSTRNYQYQDKDMIEE